MVINFRTAFISIAGVFLFHVAIMFLGVYGVIPWMDNILHFSGGFVIGLLGIALHHDMTDKHDLHGHPLWYHYLFILGFVMLVGVAWEFHEYILDNTIVVMYGWSKNQLDLADTMTDLVMDGLGGTLAFFLFKKAL